MSQRTCDELFETMVQTTGVKAFAARMGLTSRQVYRMLNGASPNPLWRICQVMDAAGSDAAQLLNYLCQRRGTYCVKVPEDLKSANLNAVKESAEAIVAISEGKSVKITVREIREAIAALAALEARLKQQTPSQTYACGGDHA